MPSKHSKNAGDRSHFTYAEKQRSSFGSQSERLSADSQLPFGHCPFSLHPIDDGVISPSGRLYSREAILEYLLTKMKEIREENEAFIQQQKRQTEKTLESLRSAEDLQIKNFEENQLGVGVIVNSNDVSKPLESEYAISRKRLIDDTDKAEKTKSLQAVCPWIPQFTPSAEAVVKPPPKRPPSPFSGRPLRAKDLIPVNLVREESSAGNRAVRFMCPISRYP